MRIQRKKPEEGKPQKSTVTPPAAQKKILKERKPTEKRKLAKESAPTPGKKKKSDLDIALESSKSVKVIAPLFVAELIDQITKDGILSNIQHYYGDMDDKEQKEIEESVLLYLDIYKKALIRIETQIPADLYNKLDARRLSAIEEDKHIKIQELLTVCSAITDEKMQECLEFANKTIFRSRHRHISLMVGKVNEIVKETHEAWVNFLVDKPGFFTSPDIPPKSDIPNIPVDAKGKGILGGDPPVLERKTSKDIPPAVTLVQDVEINKLVDNPSIIDVDTVEVHEVEAVEKTAPSGEATGAEQVKDKVDQKAEVQVDQTEVRVPVPSLAVGPSLLALDSSSQEEVDHFENNNIE